MRPVRRARWRPRLMPRSATIIGMLLPHSTRLKTRLSVTLGSSTPGGGHCFGDAARQEDGELRRVREVESRRGPGVETGRLRRLMVLRPFGTEALGGVVTVRAGGRQRPLVPQRVAAGDDGDRREVVLRRR